MLVPFIDAINVGISVLFTPFFYIKRNTLHQRSPPIHITNNDFTGVTAVFTPKAENVASRVLNINKHSAHSVSSQNLTDAIYHEVHSLMDHYY